MKFEHFLFFELPVLGTSFISVAHICAGCAAICGRPQWLRSKMRSRSLTVIHTKIGESTLCSCSYSFPLDAKNNWIGELQMAEYQCAISLKMEKMRRVCTMCKVHVSD